MWTSAAGWMLSAVACRTGAATSLTEVSVVASAGESSLIGSCAGSGVSPPGRAGARQTYDADPVQPRSACESLYDFSSAGTLHE